ncbi:hypothetical protein HPB51_007715 [Rhipicephalus microplus]|uniref:HMG box domain-containing protein n=1 Tax=Rhipicephalus microplus TaxID=6941 RepID=A0A9J6DTH1_RHIMP|nr:hypothetical protein HPB51_007715 [Rhipicephalus microplus]
MGKGDKPRGRMSAYAFFVQTCREEHKKKHPNENVVFAEFSKKCAERWKTMSDGEKKRFHQMADKDKKRFDTEMADYKPPKGDKSKKRKRAKDPNAPKRPLPNVRQENPDSSVGEVAKELGRRWNEVGDDVKAKYEGLAAKDKARYEKYTLFPEGGLIFLGIQKHIFGAALYVALGESAMRYADHRSMERDAILRRYILLHPEDFPEPERKKYRDVLEPWIPVR